MERKCCILITLLVLILLPCVEALAMDTGFSTEMMPEDMQENVIDYMDITMLDEAPKSKIISCFDVNENGLIAIGSNTMLEQIISVYSADGEFLYGYEFELDGMFGVEWDEDLIIIYTVCGDSAIAVDKTGKIVEILDIIDTPESDEYWDTVFSTRRVVGQDKYTIRNDMGILNLFLSSYSQLLKTDVNGETTIIYDVNTFHLIKTIFIVLAIIIFVGIVTTLVVMNLVKVLSNKTSN